MERETGIEPATLCLEGRCSTTELLPLAVNYNDPIYMSAHYIRNMKESAKPYCQQVFRLLIWCQLW
jgi:hypothetical protein